MAKNNAHQISETGGSGNTGSRTTNGVCEGVSQFLKVALSMLSDAPFIKQLIIAEKCILPYNKNVTSL